MPKERIHGDDPGHQPFEVVVGWQRDMDVQVGIEVNSPQSSEEPDTLLKVLYDHRLNHIGDAMRQFALTRENEALLNCGGRELGKKVLDIVEYGVTPGSPAVEVAYTGVWWHPTRHGINSLIRLLRKARDTAFGKDE